MHSRNVAVVHFVRSLHARIAGGARAVLERANMLAAAGLPSHLVVTGMVSDHDVAVMHRRGLLDPRVHVRAFWREGPDWTDLLAADAHAPLAAPVVVHEGPGLVRRIETTEVSRHALTFVGGVQRYEEWSSPNARRLRRAYVSDAEGRQVEAWRYADGQLAMVHDLDPETGSILRTHYVADARYRWLTTDLDSPVGLSRAVLPGRGETTDFGSVLGGWLDRAFADVDRVVVFADGENTCQRALRTMRHPGVRGISVLHNSHLDDPYDAEAPTKAHWEMLFEDLTNVDVMVCLTQRQRDHLVERFGALPLRVVHHSVPSPRGTEVERDPRRVVFVGRLAEQKRLEHLIAAFELVVESVPDARLDLYGSGPTEDEVRALVAEHGLAQAVTVHGHTAEPLDAFAGARVAVMTSRYEGLPLTLTEGMSVGTPFVAYDVNYGPAEVVRDGVDGYLVPPGDIALLAEKLVTVLQDDSRAAALSAAARDVLDRFSHQRYRDTWLQLTEEAIATDTGRSDTVSAEEVLAS